MSRLKSNPEIAPPGQAIPVATKAQVAVAAPAVVVAPALPPKAIDPMSDLAAAVAEAAFSTAATAPTAASPAAVPPAIQPAAAKPPAIRPDAGISADASALAGVANAGPAPAVANQVTSDRPATNGAATPTAARAPSAAATTGDESDLEGEREGWIAGLKAWVFNDAPAWLISGLVHMVLFLVLALTLGSISNERSNRDVPEFAASDTEQLPEPMLERFELGDPQLDPSELSTDSLMETQYDPVPQEAEYNDDSPEFEKRGGGTTSVSDASLGGMGLNIQASGLGPLAKGAGGLDGGGGSGKGPGRGGDGFGFGGRGAGKREGISGGGTKQTERAVAAALNWIARHQNSNGSWSIDFNRSHCTGRRCNGGGSEKADVGATALALLPFFAAGQTHMTKGPYQKVIAGGLQFIMRSQKPSGALAPDSSREMYEHGLAAITLCEAFGMSQDSRVGYSAQAAINYIEAAQNQMGGWRYKPRVPETDTSVVGWQVMALKSAQMAGLQVNPAVLARAKEDLKTAASGYKGGKFAYQANKPASPAMTGVGLLCMQYTGMSRNDPALREGIDYLLENQPDVSRKNIYYWYYATQVLHNVPGEDWEKWNRKTRRVLVETQSREGCSEGSWTPEGDEWGNSGGRLMVTSLSCLTLEVYYRYLPLYKLDQDEKDAAGELETAEAAPAPMKDSAKKSSKRGANEAGEKKFAGKKKTDDEKPSQDEP